MSAPDHQPASPRLDSVSMSTASAALDDRMAHRRRLVADLCRYMGAQLTGTDPVSAQDAREAAQLAQAAEMLSPRERQTLERLLAGDSEKQIAARLGVSRHTVHVYVKNLYRHYDVCARGELLARFVRPARNTRNVPDSPI